MARQKETEAYLHEEHRQYHARLHHALDVLLADFILHTEKLPSKTTIMELAEWSHRQTIDPMEKMPDEAKENENLTQEQSERHHS